MIRQNKFRGAFRNWKQNKVIGEIANMSEQRDLPVDIFVLQPAKPPLPGERPDPNYTAQSKTWGDGEKWTVVETVVDFVNHVKVSCGDRKYVRVLRIGGHGGSGFYLGEVWVSMSTIDVYEVWLKEIIPYLIPGKTLICLDHCHVGSNDDLLKKLSTVFGGVPVLAPFDIQFDNEGAPSFEGNGRICNTETCVTTYSPNEKPSDVLSFLAYYEVISGKTLPGSDKGIWDNLSK